MLENLEEFLTLILRRFKAPVVSLLLIPKA